MLVLADGTDSLALEEYEHEIFNKICLDSTSCLSSSNTTPTRAHAHPDTGPRARLCVGEAVLGHRRGLQDAHCLCSLTTRCSLKAVAVGGEHVGINWKFNR